MQLATRIGTMARRGAPLPYDAEVEWLESPDGTAYIDTGLVPNINDDICITVSGQQSTPLSTGGSRGGIGITNWADGPSWTSYFGDKRTIPSSRVFIIEQGVVYNLRINKYFFQCNDLKVDIGASSLSTSSKYVLFYDIWKNFGSYNCVRIFNFSIKGRCSMIPVRFTNENGETEGALYDRISGQLLRSQGTGALIIGPDKTT